MAPGTNVLPATLPAKAARGLGPISALHAILGRSATELAATIADLDFTKIQTITARVVLPIVMFAILLQVAQVVKLDSRGNQSTMEDQSLSHARLLPPQHRTC